MLQEQVKVMSHQGWKLELSRGNISTYLQQTFIFTYYWTLYNTVTTLTCQRTGVVLKYKYKYITLVSYLSLLNLHYVLLLIRKTSI